MVLSAIYGVSVYCLSEYSDNAFLDLIGDNKTQTATLYPWQVIKSASQTYQLILLV